MNTDTATCSDLVRRLTTGDMTADHGPEPVARVIEALYRERDAVTARVRELETVCLPSVQRAERNGYARGFRAATMAAAMLEVDPFTADAIVALQPNFALAGETM